MTKHTPLPWTTRKSGTSGDVGIAAPGCEGVIAECFEEFAAKFYMLPEEAAANAEFIVLACNSHEDLLRAAREALQTLDRLPADTLTVPGVSRHLRSAIAKAEGR